jgi:hypothetical protein
MKSVLNKVVCLRAFDERAGAIERVAALENALESEIARRRQAEEALKQSEQMCMALSRRIDLCGEYIEYVADFQDFFRVISEQ